MTYIHPSKKVYTSVYLFGVCVVNISTDKGCDLRFTELTNTRVHGPRLELCTFRLLITFLLTYLVLAYLFTDVGRVVTHALISLTITVPCVSTVKNLSYLVRFLI